MRLDHLLLSKDSIVLSGVFTKYLHSENRIGQADVSVPFGALAQLGEHLLCKQGVIGSIPIGSTKSQEQDGLAVANPPSSKTGQRGDAAP